MRSKDSWMIWCWPQPWSRKKATIRTPGKALALNLAQAIGIDRFDLLQHVRAAIFSLSKFPFYTAVVDHCSTLFNPLPTRNNSYGFQCNIQSNLNQDAINQIWISPSKSAALDSLLPIVSYLFWYQTLFSSHHFENSTVCKCRWDSSKLATQWAYANSKKHTTTEKWLTMQKMRLENSLGFLRIVEVSAGGIVFAFQKAERYEQISVTQMQII